MSSTQDENNRNQEFQYLTSNKGPVMVVTLIGEINESSRERLEVCQSDITSNESVKHIILYMRDVPNVTNDIVPFFTQMQKNLRTRGQLRLCSVKPELRDKLTRMGIIRGREVVNNLQLALREIIDVTD